MKKVVQITTIANSGSVGRIAEEIGQLAITKGWESYIAYGRNPRKSKSKLIRIGGNLGIILHGIRTRLFDDHGFGSTSATKKFIKRLEKIKPDVIHLHNVHGYFINIKILFEYLAKADIPVVWTLHDCWSMTGHCFHFQNLHCEKWKTACFKCPTIHTYPGSLFIDGSKGNYRRKKALFTSVKDMTITPVCDWLEGIVKESYLSKYPTKVIYNGIDTEIFRPREVSDELKNKLGVKDCFVMLAVSSVWYETKGWSDIIELSKKLDDSEKIIMVGVTEKQAKQLPSNIIPIQRTESVEELAELYSLADVLINPTYQDSLPTVDIESIACGTPVITYDTGGSKDIVTHEVGIVIPMGDKTSLHNAIKEIKEKGKSMYTDNCRKRALEYFKKEDRFVDYLNLYEQITNK